MKPLITVIVPAYNAETQVDRCLDALAASTYSEREILVIDDGSTDDTAGVSRQRGASVHKMPRQSGPGAARNLGAERAQGTILLFVDADVLVKPDTLARVAAHFGEGAEIAAVFGSYDLEPAEPAFFAQYKNLCHHFVHQQGNAEASTFWAGCGAIRRDVFLSVGGFDPVTYPRPSIEDIDLGYRLRAKGHRIQLDKDLVVTHLKRWTFIGILKSDIFDRAIPWTRLMLNSRQAVQDLNIKTGDRISSVLVGLLLACLLLSILDLRLLGAAGVLLAILVFLNRKIYGFFLRQRGLFFLLRAAPMYLLYYFYSGVTFVGCWLAHALGGRSRYSG